MKKCRAEEESKGDDAPPPSPGKGKHHKHGKHGRWRDPVNFQLTIEYKIIKVLAYDSLFKLLFL